MLQEAIVKLFHRHHKTIGKFGLNFDFVLALSVSGCLIFFMLGMPTQNSAFHSRYAQPHFHLGRTDKVQYMFSGVLLLPVCNIFILLVFFLSPNDISYHAVSIGKHIADHSWKLIILTMWILFLILEDPSYVQCFPENKTQLGKKP